MAAMHVPDRGGPPEEGIERDSSCGPFRYANRLPVQDRPGRRVVDCGPTHVHPARHSPPFAPAGKPCSKFIGSVKAHLSLDSWLKSPLRTLENDPPRLHPWQKWVSSS